MSHFDAAVIGSGPNGLAAAMVMAKAGRKVVVYEAQPTIGGGLRSMNVFEDETVHDHCASVLALAELSPFFAEFSFADLGVQLVRPHIPAVHVLPRPTNGLEPRGGLSLRPRNASTISALGPDGPAWEKMLNRFDRMWDRFQPLTRAPSLAAAAKLAPTMVPPPVPVVSAEEVVRGFKHAGTRAFFGGLAGHSILPLTRRETGAIGTVFAASAARTGWPVVSGGSQTLASRMADYIVSRGGTIRARTPISSLQEVETKGPVFFNTSAEHMARIAGSDLPSKYRRQLEAVRRGPSIFKVAYLLGAPIPWRHEPARRTATVHMGDSFEQIADGERRAWESGHVSASDHPLIILAQPTVADPSRSTAGHHTAWAYCHVPKGFEDDLSSAFRHRIEAHAPGFVDLIIGEDVVDAQRLEAENSNFAGGDITLGTFLGIGAVVRPTIRMPWSTPNPRLWICSAAAPPGPGIHGASGFYAAKAALRRTGDT